VTSGIISVVGEVIMLVTSGCLNDNLPEISISHPLANATRSLGGARRPLANVTRPLVGASRPQANVTRPLVGASRPQANVTRHKNIDDLPDWSIHWELGHQAATPASATNASKTGTSPSSTSFPNVSI
jgi:hypothetical protein